jgi:uncharacterized membrane-anchored protein
MIENLKKILILFFFLTSSSFANSSEFWSNKVDGPTNKDQAIKILEGRNLDPIEGLWFEKDLGTIVIFKEEDIFKMYIVDGPTEFNGTWEATILKRDNDYDFLSRIWYPETSGYRYATQTGIIEVYDNYFLTKYDTLSDQGFNMNSRFNRIWPADKVASNDKPIKSDLGDKFYDLGWFNLDNPKNVWVEIPGSNSEVNVLETEIYLKGQDSINAYTNLLFGNNAPENDLLILDDENYNYSIYINYKNDGYVSIDDWEDIDANSLLQELKDTSKKEVVDVKWIFKPSISKKNYITYSYETNWDNGDITLETNIISLGRNGHHEITFVSDYDIFDPKELENFAIEFANTINFKEGYRYSDYKSGDKKAAVGIGGLVAGSLGVKALAKAGVLAKLLAFAVKFWWVILAPIVAFFTFLNKKNSSVKTQSTNDEVKTKKVKKRKSRSKQDD